MRVGHKAIKGQFTYINPWLNAENNPCNIQLEKVKKS